MGLAAAVIGAGVVGAGASIASGVMSSNASQKAANTQLQGTQAALSTQQNMFDQAQNALSPYIQAGQNVLPTLQNLLTPGPSQTSTLSQLPGFQFQSQWGTRAAQNALAAQGLGGSTGPVAKAISDYNNGLAGTYYGSYVNQLQQFANSGMGAASSLAGNAINAGNAQAQTQQAGANASAAGTLGSANALSGAVNGIGNSASNALLFSTLMNPANSNNFYSTGNNALAAGAAA